MICLAGEDQVTLNGEGDTYDRTQSLLGDLSRIGAERILKEASEAEVDEFSQRDWYERSGDQTYTRRYSNGYSPVAIKTTSGQC